jgi:hypothetical protein
MLLTFNYFLIDVKQIIYLSTVFAAETEVIEIFQVISVFRIVLFAAEQEVMGTMAK